MQIFNDFHAKLLRNNSQLALNKFGYNLLFPNSKECVIRRDYILHRLGATFQQLSFLRQLIDSHASRYMNESVDAGKKLELTFNAINSLSYCFDNLIFNLASLSDYFGNYLGLYVYGPKFQSLKWNGFVNKTNSEYSGHDFNSLVSHEHRDWFNKLHEYRGDIIHRKAILIEVDGFKNTRLFPHTVENLEFKINSALKNYFHLLRKDERGDLFYCAEKMCRRTLDGLSGILDLSEAIEFDESHKKFAAKYAVNRSDPDELEEKT